MRSALGMALALVTACGIHAVRRAERGPVRERAPGRSVVAFRLWGERPARCRVELERAPAAVFALGTAMIARESGDSGDVTAADVELEGERPVLTIQLSAPAGDAKGEGTPDRFCERARVFAADAEGAAELATAMLWPLELDAGSVHFRSVQRLSRDGKPSGFAEYWIGARPDGTRVLGARGGEVVRRGGEWRATDLLQVEETDARGMLQHGRYVGFTDRFRYRVEVRRTGDRTFTYAGSVKGKQLDGSFEAPGGLATTLFRVELLRERAGSVSVLADPVRVEMYVPGVDPTRGTAAVYRRDPARARGFLQEVGPRESAGVVDRDGVLEWLEQKGDSAMRFETISRSGVP